MPGFDAPRVLALAALASSDGGQDPVDGAVRKAAGAGSKVDAQLLKFVPFDPRPRSARHRIGSGRRDAMHRQGRV
jgi:H+-transporting ATPase